MSFRFGVIQQKNILVDIVYTYSTPGSNSVNIPAGYGTLIMECYGGGGAGAGITSGFASQGAGAGGQYSKTTITGITAGQAVNSVVAATRVGTTGNASDGNESTVTVNSVLKCRAMGGQSAIGTGGGAGSTTSGVGDIVRKGGNGGAFISLGSGSGGGCAGPTSNGGNGGDGPGTQGTGGGGVAGAGGNGFDFDGDGNGGTGSIYGGGGGGAVRAISGSYSGGDGRSGYVKLTFQQGNL